MMTAAAHRGTADVGESDRRTATSVALTLGLSYVLLRPVSNNQVLIPVLLCLAGASVISIRLTGGRIAAELRPPLAVLLALGAYGTCLGLVRNNPGWVTGLLAYVVGPLLWWTWVAAGSNAIIRSTFAAIAWCTIITGAIISLYSLSQQGVLPAIVPDAILTAQGAGFRSSDGLTELRYFGLSTLAATGPICAAIVVVPRHRLLPSPRLAAIAAVAATFASLQAGRRGHIVLTLLVFALIPLTQKLLGARTTRRAVSSGQQRPSTSVLVAFGACCALASAFVVGVTPPKAIVSAISTTFSFLLRSQESADEVRLLQSNALTDGWLERPLTGQGFGATIDGLVRSEERPWNFELQYHELLFQTGAVGVAAVIISALLLVRALRSAISVQPSLSAPILVASIGALSMLIVNATNPYLKAPGHLWALFFPLMIANVAFSTGTEPSDHGVNDEL